MLGEHIPRRRGKRRMSGSLGFCTKGKPLSKIHRTGTTLVGGITIRPCAQSRRIPEDVRRPWIGQPVETHRLCRICWPEFHRNETET